MSRYYLPLVALLCLNLGEIASAKQYALVVGVKSYRTPDELPDLAYAENDAEGLASVLKAAGYNVTLMTEAEGRKDNKGKFRPESHYIRDQLTLTLDHPFLKPEDIVIVALAGHGVQYEEIDEQGNKRQRFFFCPADADIRGLGTADDVSEKNRLIDLNELYSALEKCKAGGKLLLVDACRNDPSKPSVTRSPLASKTLPPLPPPPGGTAAFFSCSANERAFEDGELKRGVFFHHVIEALKGDADTSTPSRPADKKITLAELSEHVGTSTYDFVRERFPGVRQAPELKGQFRLAIPLVDLEEFDPTIDLGRSGTGKSGLEVPMTDSLKIGGKIAIENRSPQQDELYISLGIGKEPHKIDSGSQASIEIPLPFELFYFDGGTQEWKTVAVPKQAPSVVRFVYDLAKKQWTWQLHHDGNGRNIIPWTPDSKTSVEVTKIKTDDSPTEAMTRPQVASVPQVVTPVPSGYSVTLGTLVCNAIEEDFQNYDDARLTVYADGRQVFDQTQKMRKGQSWNLNQSISFKQSIQISLTEWDGKPSNSETFSGVTITPNQLTGSGQFIYRDGTGTASYSINWRN